MSIQSQTNEKIRSFDEFLSLIYERGMAVKLDVKALSLISEVCLEYKAKFEPELNYELPFEDNTN